MKLTKRQLGRIIREEYTKLQRQSLLRESSLDDYYAGNYETIGRFMDKGKSKGSKSKAKEVYKYILKCSEQGNARNTCSEDQLESMFGHDVFDLIEHHPKLEDVYRTGSPDLGRWYEVDIIDDSEDEEDWDY